MKGCVVMNLLGNIIWFLFGGLFAGLCWCLVGIFWCITIIGIPLGMQCFKFAVLSLFPFGKDIEYGGGVGSLLMNVLWWLLGGLELALVHVVFGLILCCTIIGIPFGMQHFKLAKLAILPVGATIIER